MDKLNRRFINWVFEFAFMVGLLSLIGSLLDKKFNTGANLLSLGLLFAFIIEGWNFYKIYQAAVEESRKKK